MEGEESWNDVPSLFPVEFLLVLSILLTYGSGSGQLSVVVMVGCYRRRHGVISGERCSCSWGG